MLPIARTFLGFSKGIRARSRLFWGAVAGVFVFNLAAPVVILSIARKPLDFFMFNPWLARLPGYLASGEIPLAKKLDFLSHVAIAWFGSSTGYEGVAWGYVIDVPSLARILLASLVFGAYFALWSHRRRQARACGRGLKAARAGGVAGAVTSVLGLTTGPCSVVGCGVPVLPVVGLAFTGLSSGTLSFFTTVARAGFTAVLCAMGLAILWFSWRVGADDQGERKTRGHRYTRTRVA